MRVTAKTIIHLMLCIGIVSIAKPEERHWVGADSTNGRLWDQALNWSTTQDGPGGAGVPTSADTVYIDGGTGDPQINIDALCCGYRQTSGTRTVTFSSSAASLTVGPGGILISTGTLNVNNGNTINNAGLWDPRGGIFTAGTGTVVFNGTSNQTINGSSTFYNLRVNNAAGVSLNANNTVTWGLTLTSGVVTTGLNSLILTSSASVGRTNGYINGNFQKFIPIAAPIQIFEIGDLAYSPVTVSFANMTAGGNLTVRATGADHPDISASPLDNSKSVNRYWTLTNSGIAF